LWLLWLLSATVLLEVAAAVLLSATALLEVVAAVLQLAIALLPSIGKLAVCCVK
jgi:hypothetical protein